MSFDVLLPSRTPGTSARGEVRLRLHPRGPAGALTLSVAIGGDIAARLAWTKGLRVAIGIGAVGSVDRGRLSIWAAPDGHYRLMGGDATTTLRVETRVLHHTLIRDAGAASTADVVVAEGGRLTVRIPTAMLKPTREG